MKNNWLTKISTSVARKAGKTELLLKKNSPEILLGIGIITFVGTVVAACKATSRADEILEYHKKKIKDIHDAKELADGEGKGIAQYEYDDDLYKRDLAARYLRMTGSVVKLYAPTITLGTLSLVCILVSRNIMQKRYLGVVAAYNSLSAVFNQYRKRVREEYGEELDRHFRYGTEYGSITESGVDENGKKTKTKVKTSETNTELISPNDDTCRFFDSNNPNWDENPAFNMMFLRAQENYLNDLLHTRGHVFLNEVYDALGFPHTPQGAVLGWIAGGGDDCIDFGLYNKGEEVVRNFVNGTDNVSMLEFNHDGVIYDKI